MGYRVIFAARADRDLGDIVRFLARLSPAAAERLGYALFDDAMSLAELPRRGLAAVSRCRNAPAIVASSTGLGT